MSQSVKYVGLDVHKDTIAIAVAEDGKRAEVREHGEIGPTHLLPLRSCSASSANQASSCTFATRRDHADTAFSDR